MEIRVLRYFLAVAQEESITKAASVLHITQPTLSRQLADLEEETGTALFERGKRKLELTDAGRLLKQRAEEIVSLADKTMADLSGGYEEVSGIVSIGCGELKAMELLSKAAAAFHEQYPDVQFEFYTENSDAIRNQMETGLIDIGLLLEPGSLERYAFVRLNQKEQWIAAVRTTHPLAEKDCITADDLKGIQLVLPARSEIRGVFEKWYGDREAIESPYICNLGTNACVIAASTDSAAIVIDSSLPMTDEYEMKALPLNPPLSSDIYLVWKKSAVQSNAVKKFIEFVNAFEA